MTLPVPFCQDVSAPSSPFLFAPPALSTPSLFQLCVAALTNSGWLGVFYFFIFSQGVFLFSGIKLILRSSDFPHKRLVNTHYETKLASSCLLVSLSSASNSFHGKQQT